MNIKVNKLVLNTVLVANLFGGFAYASDVRGWVDEGKIESEMVYSRNLLSEYPGDRVKVFQFKEAGSLSIRAEFVSENLPEETIIVVRSDDGSEKYIYANKKDLWETMTISGDAMSVEVHLPKGSDYSSASLILKRIFYTPYVPQTKAIIGESDERQRLACYKDLNGDMYNHGLSSVHMRMGRFGSGSILGKDNLFLTNRHVVSTAESVKNGEIWLNWSHSNCDEQDNKEKNPIKIQGDKLLAVGESNDYSLLTADSFDFKYGNIKRLFGGLAISKHTPAVGEPLYIPQYGNGGIRPAYIADKESGVACELTEGGDDFYHNCDTQGGSSGSPVLSQNSHELVGLHYAATPGNNLAVSSDTLSKELAGFITEENNQEQLPVQHEINASQATVSPFTLEGELINSEKPMWFTSSDPELKIEHRQKYSLVSFFKKNQQTGEVILDENKPKKLWLQNDCGEFPIDQNATCSSRGKTRLMYSVDVDAGNIQNESWKKFWLLLTRHTEQGEHEEDVFQFNENLYDLFNPPFDEGSAIVKDLVLEDKVPASLSWKYEGSDYLGLVTFYGDQGPTSLVWSDNEKSNIPVMLKDEKTGVVKKAILSVTRETACSLSSMNSAVSCGSTDKYTRFNVHFDPKINSSFAEGSFKGILSLKMKSWSDDTERNVIYKISINNEEETPSDIPEWSSTKNYAQACEKVRYNGKVWMNGWWSNNNQPGSDGVWGVWRQEGAPEMHSACK